MANTVLNSITYTAQRHDGVRYEQTTRIDRPYKLTKLGAQRILRAQFDMKDLTVVRVEGMVYA